MGTFRDKDFVGKAIVLDGNTFTGCTFKRCRVIFKGEKATKMVACTFHPKSTLTFKSHAAKTIVFLSDMYHSGAKNRLIVDKQIFASIKRGVRRKN